MAFITDILNTIKNARKGKDMRQAIHDGIEQCYKDATGHPESVAATVKKIGEVSANLLKETADRKAEVNTERKRIDNLIKELPTTAGEYQQSKLVSHGYNNTAVKCTTTSGNYTNVPTFTTDQGGPLSSLHTKKSNYQIAVNKSGLYLFELRIHVNSLVANKRVELVPFINNTRNAALASSYNTVGNFTLTTVAALPIWLSANDTVDFRIAPIDAAEVSLQLADVLVYAIDWEDKFKIPDYTGYTAETRDIRTGADGTVYGTAGEAVRKQIGNLTEDLSNVVSVGFQYLNPSNGERNKYYYAYGKSKDSTDSNYVVFPIISLPAGKYYTQNLSDTFTFLDDGTALKNFSGYNTADQTLILDTSRKISVTGFGDSQVPMTISNIEVSDNRYGIVSVKIIGDNISKRTESLESKTESLESRTIVTVGIGKDFTSIKDAVASITDSSKNNIYDIYIDDGTYEEYAITLPDHVNLIGASGNREKCVIKGELPDSASANEITVNSTLNLKDSNVLENLTITAKNLRYPIHSESGGTHTNWTQILNNCHVEHFGNTSPNNKWTSYHAWGEGASSGAYAEFNNCVFKSPAEPWYVHEFAYLPDVPKPYHHILNNCQIINTTISSITSWLCTAKIDNTKNSGIINTIDFNNCNFYNGEIAINDICAININIHGGNNAAIRFKNSCPDTDYTHIKTYIGEESITRNTVLKYVNGINLVEKANANTPADMIAGIAVESCESNSLVKIIKGSYIQNAGRIGNKVYCDDNGQIANTGIIEIGTYYGEFCLIN